MVGAPEQTNVMMHRNTIGSSRSCEASRAALENPQRLGYKCRLLSWARAVFVRFFPAQGLERVRPLWDDACSEAMTPHFSRSKLLRYQHRSCAVVRQDIPERTMHTKRFRRGSRHWREYYLGHGLLRIPPAGRRVQLNRPDADHDAHLRATLMTIARPQAPISSLRSPSEHVAGEEFLSNCQG